MLRGPQHERRNINEINIPPFVLSTVEGLLGVFQQPVSESVFNVMTIIFTAAMAYSPNHHQPGEEHK